MKSTLKLSLVCAAGILAAGSLHAYDGTNCEAAGDCWEAKPGYPEKIAGSKFDPKHSKVELESRPRPYRPWKKEMPRRPPNSRKRANGQPTVDIRQPPISPVLDLSGRCLLTCLQRQRRGKA